MEDVPSKNLIPVTVPSGVSLASPEIFQMIRCGCTKEDPCSDGKCSCVISILTCTPFCNCYGKDSCHNPWTKFVQNEPDDIENDVRLSDEEHSN